MGMPCSVWAGCVIGVIVPAALFVFEYCIEMKGMKDAKAKGIKRWMTLTPQKTHRDFRTGEIIREEGEVDFDPRHGHYLKCGEVVVTLASASLVFIPSMHFSSGLPFIGFPMVLLGFTVVYAVGFMGILTYFYEMFLFDQNSLTVFRSSVIFCLGFGALTCFLVAYFALSLIVGTALSNGSLVNSVH